MDFILKNVINLNGIVLFRHTLKLPWRIVISLIFLVLANAFWTAFHLIPGHQIARTFYLHPISTSLFNSVALIISVYAIIRRNLFSTIYFAIATSVPGFTLILLLGFGFIDQMKNKTDPILVFYIFLFSVTTWRLFIRYTFILWKAVLPFAKWKFFQDQVRKSSPKLTSNCRRISDRVLCSGSFIYTPLS